jgi:sphinganine-1-phosphate aldolase
MKTLPRTGHAQGEVLAAMESLRDRDVRWRDGRVFSLVFHVDDEFKRFVHRAYGTFMAENGLNPSAFPSLRRMENEVVSMTARLLGGGPDVVGNMTSGGTESILMAVKCAVEWGRVHRPRVKRLEMVLPRTAHPAFEKAAHYFGITPVFVPIRADYRVDVRKARRAIGRRTVLVVGSAPQYPQGVVDPIEELAALARRRGILCHVDACVGGMMLPFVRDLGNRLPPFDFAVPGVTSMSVDLHKYGYAAKGASVVLYRDAGIRRHAYFASTDWPGGIYASPSMAGTRPGGGIAAAWAVMHHLGFDGYRAIADDVMRTSREIRRGIDGIEGLCILGEPDMSVMGIASTDARDIYVVGDHMTERGWHLDRQQNPNCLHLTINAAHLHSAEQLLADLREASRLSARDEGERRRERTRQLALNAVIRVLPRRVTKKLTDLASRRMGVGGGGDLPEKTAAMYGMMASLPNRGDIHRLVIDALDGMTRPGDDDEEILPER